MSTNRLLRRVVNPTLSEKQRFFHKVFCVFWLQKGVRFYPLTVLSCSRTEKTLQAQHRDANPWEIRP